MGQIKKHPPVKLITGLIYKDEAVFGKAKKILGCKFGVIDFISPPMPFTHTDYYRCEFGSGLKRRFISFKKLILAQSLPEIKIAANKIEKKLTKHNLRLINIDPGYLNLGKLLLATTKDYAHRIYLDKGIYAEVTLFYQNKSYQPWEWTYPDYKTAEYINIFGKIRNIYAEQIKNK